jgi:hypothetical protein
MDREYAFFNQSREMIKGFLETITEENYYPGMSVHFSIIAGHWCISSRNYEINIPSPDLRTTKEEIEEFMKGVKELAAEEAARKEKAKEQKEKEEEELLNKI